MASAGGNKLMAAALRIISRGTQNAWAQLGHRERENVYQRALAAELEAQGWCVELEAPVTVKYNTLPTETHPAGRTVVLSHDRADIIARLCNQTVVVEVKKGGPAKAAEARDQVFRYAKRLKDAGSPIAGAVVVLFPKLETGKPTVENVDGFL